MRPVKTEDLYHPVHIEALLERHGFHFAKSLGQNFLTEAYAAQAAAETVDKRCGVLEIGPGHGALTVQLARTAARVVAVEQDRRLETVLAETLEGLDNVTVRFADALRTDWAELCREAFGGLEPCLCANLPYNITTPILERAARAGCFARITVMVQREAGERLLTRPGDERWGVLPALLAARYTGERLMDVSRACFLPPPHVDSCILTFRRMDTPIVGEGEWAAYERVVRAVFAQRRKVLSNALRAADISPDVLEGTGIDPRLRGERLLPQDLLKIARRL